MLACEFGHVDDSWYRWLVYQPSLPGPFPHIASIVGGRLLDLESDQSSEEKLCLCVHLAGALAHMGVWAVSISFLAAQCGFVVVQWQCCLLADLAGIGLAVLL